MAQPSLLSDAQRSACQAQADQPAPNGPRARALLALGQGSNKVKALKPIKPKKKKAEKKTRKWQKQKK